jgi:hypothetical protein
MNARELLEAHPECVWPGSPRDISVVHTYIPVWAAAEVMERELGRKDQEIAVLVDRLRDVVSNHWDGTPR